MRRLSNRLLLSWLTVVALLAFALVAAFTPDGVSISGLTFARSAERFRTLLVAAGSSTIAIQTVNMLRAQFAADMVFLVAYGVLLWASARALTSSRIGRAAARGALLLMIADATENVFALSILRTLGDERGAAPDAWFTVMNGAAAAKWALAGAVLLAMGVGWWREPAAPIAWRSWTARVIAVMFAAGGLASWAVLAGFLVDDLPRWIGLVALGAPAAALLLQFRLLDTSALTVRFLYLIRVPFAILVIMAAFGPVALGPAVDLLGGLLVATTVLGVAVTSAATVALIFACITQIDIVRAYGWLRVHDETLRVLDHEIVGYCVFWTGNVAGLSLLFSVSVASPGSLLGNWNIAAGAAIGSAAALFLLFWIQWVAARVSHVPEGYPRQEVLVPFRLVPQLDKALTTASAAKAPQWTQHRFDWLVSRLFGLASGYVETLPDDTRRILPLHSYAAVQFVLTVVLFWGALELKGRPDTTNAYQVSAAATEAQFLVPTVTSVLLLLLLLGWALAAVAFFVDRYRTPLFTIAVAVAFATGALPSTDYRVAVPGGTGTYELATPGQVLTAFGRKPLVVAAAGGGIQAGAWTARVLQGIDDQIGSDFRKRVAVLSSVSGGSMGTLYYGAFLREPTLQNATQQALKPSLDEIATSLVSRDIWGVSGWRFGRDRGAALEESWEARLPPARRHDATLRRWSDATREFARGRRDRAFPAFLFNSTIVESGQPLAFATTQFPTRGYRRRFDLGARQYPAVESASRILRLTPGDGTPVRDVGLKVSTVARLSAGFPYVSPAATVDLRNVEPFHLVDGGYYDTYGLVALSQWLDDALEEITDPAKRPTAIGVVIVRGLASSDSALLTRLRDDDPTTPTLDSSIEPRGWRWQLTAPPATALNARTYGQWAGSVQVLKLLIDKWARRDVQIVPYVFDYPGSDRTPVCQSAPLSWKLTTTQQTCIEAAWRTFKADPASALYKLR